MTKKQITLLAKKSYTADTLDEKKVTAIAAHLSRKELKEYIRQMKLLEKKQNIYIAMPDITVYNKSKKLLEEIFTDKKHIIVEDPSLLLGVRIIKDDIVYEYNLKQAIDNINQHINQNY